MRAMPWRSGAHEIADRGNSQSPAAAILWRRPPGHARESELLHHAARYTPDRHARLEKGADGRASLEGRHVPVARGQLAAQGKIRLWPDRRRPRPRRARETQKIAAE